MVCEYCGENDELNLVMRSRIIRGEVEIIQICISCLWIKLTEERNEDEQILP